MSGTVSRDVPEVALGQNAETLALLDGVAGFAQAEIAARIPAHDEPLMASALREIADAATAAGLLDDDPEGAGLWSSDDSDRFWLSTMSLRILARASAGAALQLHLAALASAAARSVWDERGLESPATIALGGRLGIGGAALGRWLAGHPEAGDDRAVLDDVHGPGERLRWTAGPAAPWITLRFIGGEAELALLPGGGERDAAPHGPDGLEVVRRSAADALTAAPTGRAQLASLLAAHQAGLVAIAQGSADAATERAAAYAASRHQGGGAIIGHDAVALMATAQQVARRSAEAQIAAVAATAPERRLAAAVALRLGALPELHRAACAAVQMHGGSGYMRDTGVEHLLRETGALRLIGGAPDDLALLLAGLTTADAATHEPCTDERRIAGHARPQSALDPQPGFRRHPVLRALSSYEPLDSWERDNRDLPRPLAGYRRRLRDFARREIAPVAGALDLETTDAAAEPAALAALLANAGRAGLLTDLLPRPVGSVPLARYRTSLVLQQALRTEELAAADGGLMLYLSAHNLGLAPILFSGNRSAYWDVIRPAFRACANGVPEVFAFAITEPGAGSDAEDGHGAALAKPGLVASRASGGWTLDGGKVFISGGDIARWVVAFAALEGEGFDSWTAFLVDTRSPGFEVLRKEHKMGMRASGAAAIAFDGCFVPDELVLGGQRGGWALNRATLNFSRLPVAAMSVGFARHATEIAMAFACHERVAGRPLIDRQHVQLALAEMQAETAAIRALVWQFSRRRVPEQAKASIAKFQASDRAQVVIERAMALLGEQALLHGTGLERVFRDNRLTRIFEGTNQINRLAVIEDQQELLLARVRRAP